MDRPNRSHPTLTPLTSLPTSPHASTSYLYPTTSIPTTPSLLSRPSSQTRLRPARSAPTPVPVPTSTSTSNTTGSQNPPQKKKPTGTTTTTTPINGADDDDDWLTRTASTLTLTRLEEKGQSWLAARHSSTGLNGGDDEYDEARSPAERWSGSRAQSARGSEARLQGLRSRGQSGIRRNAGVGGGDGTGDAGEGGDVVRPDFVDVEEELEEEGGVAEGEGEGEVVDEGEMRRVVLGRVGGWVDWAVGWMDFRGEGEGEEEGEEDEVHGDGREGDGAAREKDGGAGGKGELDAVELQKRLRREKRKDEEAETGGEGANAVGSAPETAGLWSDAKWLLGVAAKAAL